MSYGELSGTKWPIRSLHAGHAVVGRFRCHLVIGEPQAEALRRREAIDVQFPLLESELEQLSAETETLSNQTASGVFTVRHNDRAGKTERDKAQAVATRLATLANAMRCVLDRFFYFVSDNEKFDAALTALAQDNPSFRSFARYLDRGSHADRTNITDFSGYDANLFLAQFRRFFEQTGYSPTL